MVWNIVLNVICNYLMVLLKVEFCVKGRTFLVTEKSRTFDYATVKCRYVHLDCNHMQCCEPACTPFYHNMIYG